MTDGEAFLDALRTHPADDSARRVYADWLEEQGDPASAAKAAYLRVECDISRLAPGDPRQVLLKARRRDLAAKLDATWLALVGKPAIENCGQGPRVEGRGLHFRFVCPKQWEQLQPTADNRVRFCEACQRGVHYCASMHEARNHVLAGDCVAVDPRLWRYEGDLQPRHLTIELGEMVEDDDSSDEGGGRGRGEEPRRQSWWRRRSSRRPR
jgi:uncharacterized protein (TIGR02996 family)